MRRAAFALAIALLAPATLARADRPLRFREQAEGVVRIDGMLRDWRDCEFVQIGDIPDAAMNYCIAYDARGFFVAAAVYDDRFVRTRQPGRSEDAIVLTLLTPGAERARPIEVWLFAGVAGRSPARALVAAPGAPLHTIRGADIVEGPGPRPDQFQGYSVEAFIPWTAIPGHERWQEARGAIRLRDVDQEARPTVEAEPASATFDPAAPESMPPVRPSGGEQAILQAFYEAQRLGSPAPRLDQRADVAEDARLERVLVVDRWLLVLGPSFDQGRGYRYFELPVRAAEDVRRAELLELTGDRRPELVLVAREAEGRGTRDLYRVYGLGTEPPTMQLALEVRKEIGPAVAVAEVEVRRDGRGAPSIVQTSGSASAGAEVFSENVAPNVGTMIYSWGRVASRAYRWQRNAFVAEEVLRAVAAPSSATTASASTAAVGGRDAGVPSRPSSGAPTAEVDAGVVVEDPLIAFRRERRLERAPLRFDLSADVSGDARNERVVVLGSSVLVFGPGFQGGTSYFFYDVPVTNPADLLDVQVVDLTGDRKAEILFRLRQERGPLTHEVLMVHHLRGSTFTRLLAVEVARRQGEANSIVNEVRFVGRGASRVLEILPGRARGWTAESYPYRANEASDITSVLLPWSASPVRYRLDGPNLRAAARN